MQNFMWTDLVPRPFQRLQNRLNPPINKIIDMMEPGHVAIIRVRDVLPLMAGVQIEKKPNLRRIIVRAMRTQRLEMTFVHRQHHAELPEIGGADPARSHPVQTDAVGAGYGGASVIGRTADVPGMGSSRINSVFVQPSQFRQSCPQDSFRRR